MALPGGGSIPASQIPDFRMATPVAAAPPQSVEVRIDNRGQPQRVSDARATFDMGRTIINLVVEDILSGRATSRAIRATSGRNVF